MKIDKYSKVINMINQLFAMIIMPNFAIEGYDANPKLQWVLIKLWTAYTLIFYVPPFSIFMQWGKSLMKWLKLTSFLNAVALIFCYQKSVLWKRNWSTIFLLYFLPSPSPTIHRFCFLSSFSFSFTTKSEFFWLFCHTLYLYQYLYKISASWKKLWFRSVVSKIRVFSWCMHKKLCHFIKT